MINKCKEKIILTYKDYNGVFKEESVLASKEGKYYRLKSIPFFAHNLSYGDLVEAEEDEGEFHFLDLIEASGHSTIQVVFLDSKFYVELVRYVESMECGWGGIKGIENYICINIPKEVDYTSVENFLISGMDSGKWDYREACLSDKHKTDQLKEHSKPRQLPDN